MNIKDLGYDDFFESNRIKLELDSFQIARVIAEYKEVYKIKDADGEYLAKITGKQIFEASTREDYPAIGDWVAFAPIDKENAVIHKIFPRRTIMKRKYCGKNESQIIATNVDVAYIIESIDRDYNLNRFERYFAIAMDGGIKLAIVLNKIDLISKDELGSKLLQIKNRFRDVDIISISALTNEGLDELRRYILSGKTYCFLGSSGVGKSSLINKLIGTSKIKTGDVSSHSGRGKHITTAREMYFLEKGGIVIDNPGMREIGMTDTNTGIDGLFDEIGDLSKKCKFKNCTHINESGCEVLNALKSGRLDDERYSNYIHLKKETEYYEMTNLEKEKKIANSGSL